jgi:tetratricopeptide (TPR) repeat protein
LGKAEYDRAIDDLNIAILFWPKNATCYHYRARAWLKKEDYDKAIQDYDEILRLLPDPAVALVFGKLRELAIQKRSK